MGALFELKHDNMPDDLQADLLEKVESHLRKLEKALEDTGS